ncbi:CRISPR-associated protein Cas4 (plasmid) [Haloarcula salina]|uniref:CRISPR-associated protein Cas4 n=1 Tax=Haloarcula salina TaxID=1429914 RepID=UPI003C6F59AB
MVNTKSTTESNNTGGASVTKIVDTLTAENFENWYRSRKFRQNIQDGKPYFNGPSPVTPPERHSPSKLLQCHRKIYYRQENAPEEQDDAEGVLWTGRRIEEDVVLPFLRDVVSTDQTYVRNSIWIDFNVEKQDNELAIKGMTDPVLVDEESSPLLPTEVKTTSSIEYKDSPDRHHRAQLHAYLAGLSAEYDRNLTEGVLLYVSRETFDIKAFPVEFDAEFWSETVVSWANTHTEYRLGNELPPAQPEANWECGYCSYRERCGRGDTPYTDMSPEGFLPNVDSYPRNKVREYLNAHDGAMLTPTLAEKYPDLAEEHGVQFWECPNCSTSFEKEKIPGEFGPDRSPLCPHCAQSKILAELRLSVPTDRGV